MAPVATEFTAKPRKVHRNGFLSRWFHRSMNANTCVASSAVERKLLRRRLRRASTPKKSSISSRGAERILPARGGLGKQFGGSGRRCDPVVGMVARWGVTTRIE